MIVSDHLANRKGVLLQDRDLECPKCKGRARLSLLYYVDIDSVPAFPSLMTDGLKFAECCECNSPIDARSPLIADLPSRNLVVFVTHGSDDGGVVAGFERWKTFVGMLDEDRLAEIKTRPYCFVYGWRGLQALLDAFRGNPPIEPQPPFPHSEDDHVHADSLAGYRYGSVFFYYPAQRPIDLLTQVILRFGEDARSLERRQRLRRITQSVCEIVRTSHPWLLTELGRLLIDCGEIKTAKHWLEKAKAAEHAWLAPTINFLDATPTRRADGAAQDPELPSTEISVTLAEVTKHRHMVTYYSPATKDYGLWHFPYTAECVIPEDYSSENLAKAFGLALGSFEWEIQASDEAVGNFAFQQVGFLQRHIRQFLDVVEEPARELFWSSYIRSRWDIELQDILNTFVRPPDLEKLKVLETLGAIRAAVRMIPDDPKEGQFSLISKGFLARDCKFYCHEAASRIRGVVFNAARRDATLLADDKLRSIWRKPCEVGSEFKSLMGEASGPKEPDDLLSIAFHVLCRLVPRCFMEQCQMWIAGIQSLVALATPPDALRSVGEVIATSPQEINEQLAQISLAYLIAKSAERTGPPSWYERKRSRCINCRQDFEYLKWIVINVSNRPFARSQAQCADLLHVRCPICGLKTEILPTLLYWDSERDLYFAVSNGLGDDSNDQLRTLAQDYFNALPACFRKGKPNLAVASHYERDWKNAEDYIIVSMVGAEEFKAILGY